CFPLNHEKVQVIESAHGLGGHRRHSDVVELVDESRGPSVLALTNKIDRKERIAEGIGFWPDLLDNILEGNVLVGEGLPDRIANTAREFLERGIAGNFGAQR